MKLKGSWKDSVSLQDLDPDSIITFSHLIVTDSCSENDYEWQLLPDTRCQPGIGPQTVTYVSG